MALQGTRAAGCTPSVAAYIDGTEVPVVSNNEGTGGARIHMRKTGPSYLTRFSELTIPFEWGGEDVISAIPSAAFNGPNSINSCTSAPVRIEVRNENTGQYYTVHHGPIAGAGGANIRGCFKLHITDWANYLESMGASIELLGSMSVEDAASAVVGRATEHGAIPNLSVAFGSNIDQDRGVIAEDNDGGDDSGDTNQELSTNASYEQINQEIDDDISGTTIREGSEQVEEEADAQIENFTEGVTPSVQRVATRKAFDRYNHSLAFLFDFIAQSQGGIWFIRYNGGPEVLIARPEAYGQRYSGSEITESGQIPVISNNALYDINPQHTLTAVGGEGWLESTVEDASFGAVEKRVPKVTVAHGRLEQIAGTNPSPREYRVEANSIQKVEKKAKDLLMQQIGGAAGGEIVCKAAPAVTPYDSVRAKAACGGREFTESKSIRYSVEETIHEIEPVTPKTNGPRTMLRCGIAVTPSNIYVKDSTFIDDPPR